ncbi:serine/threonine-protein kinase [Cryptosporangium aurantiacum]|uniref:Serine/threonine protein kinase n=1 Tax=Cryptosporangium aurantiacum TaxID=134849 RepID=A0A1M7RHB8_9ACTN|nr:serine/threonine-protein kinase [Cryptosporangium aurantiacum]SHN45620.1 Serine/threonine protein kinase [Cryptosporangium aurantiacum]
MGQLGQYRLVGVLGTGGMGTVYLGRSPGGRLVAVKAVHGHLALNPDFRIRFRREVALAQRVGGPFTAAMLDADPDGDPPWLATEYIRGQSLAQVLNEHGALPEDTVRALAAGLAEALQVIHAAGVVHRDLKPSNVLLSENGPRVIDFGIAKAVEGIDLTGDGPLLGTPGYMSPEHLAGAPLAPSSDVFSLGAVLAHAATGVAPFGAGQSFAVANRVATAPPDLSGLPPGLAELIGRCLAKEPTERPSLDWIVRQVGSFADQDSWLPSEVGNAIRHRPAATRPFTNADAPPPGARPGARPAAPAASDEEPPDLVAYLADRFSRRAGGPPIEIGAARTPAPARATAAAGAAAAAPEAPPAQVGLAKLKEGAARLQGAAARLRAATARPPEAAPPPGVVRPGAGRPGAGPSGAGPPGAVPPPGGVPPQQRAPWNPNGVPQARTAAPPLRAPRRVPWQRLQCPPVGTATGRKVWSRWLLVLILLGLLDAIAQAPFVRQLFVDGGLTEPSWLSRAFETSTAIDRQTSWLPDPATSWITADGTADPGTVASRLAAVPLTLLICVALIRRGGTTNWMMWAKTAAGWIGTLIAAFLILRYLATGFASLLWAVATLQWGLLFVFPPLAFLTIRAAGSPR